MAEIAIPRDRQQLDAFVTMNALRPALSRFLAFWFDWTDALGQLPSRPDCDPVVLKPWLPTVRIIRIEPGHAKFAGRAGLRFRYYYRLIGTEHRKYDDRDFTNTYLDETNLSLERAAFLGASYERLIESRWPILMNHAHFGAGQGVYACQRIICPLAEPDGAVTELFGVWSYGGLIAAEHQTDDITKHDLQLGHPRDGKPEERD